MRKTLKDGRLKFSCDICGRTVQYFDRADDGFGWKTGEKVRPWHYCKTGKKDRNGCLITHVYCEDCMNKPKTRKDGI